MCCEGRRVQCVKASEDIRWQPGLQHQCYLPGKLGIKVCRTFSSSRAFLIWAVSRDLERKMSQVVCAANRSFYIKRDHLSLFCADNYSAGVLPTSPALLCCGLSSFPATF